MTRLAANTYLAVSLVYLGFLASASGQQVDYATQIKPLLATKCFACHGALKQESGLRLDAALLIREGGDGGPVIEPGDATASLLIERVTAEYAGERMPPSEEGEPLTGEQIALLRRWVDEGALAPDEPIPGDPREHWAYQQPQRPPIPRLGYDAPLVNEVDALLAASQARAGIRFAAFASEERLLRRVYLDLIGLPPTRQQLHAFLRDNSSDAYERVVDRLLASPQYGERWGRHWMDIWRYSDWAGFGEEIRYSQRHIWRWRDWIVESLNTDKGYDRMVLEMLAADELIPNDSGTIRATGFLARNWYKFDRNAWLDDVIEHTGKAFLATTFNCARCHDHKYDPLLQQEYYQLRAIFEPYDVRTDRRPGELDVRQDGVPRVFDANPDAPTYLFVRGDPKQADKTVPLQPAVAAVLGGELQVEPVELPLEAYYPALRRFVRHDLVAKAKTALETAEVEHAAATEQAAAVAVKKVAAARAELAAIQARIEAEDAKHGRGEEAEPELRSLVETAARAERAACLAQAEYEYAAAEQALREAEVEKDRKAINAARSQLEAAETARRSAKEAAQQTPSAYEPLGTIHPATSSGRRLALARWIVDRQNPLAARVAVNHLWVRHFGRPLVDSVEDFGLRSPRPPLAELLDFLAVELMENGWSMKHLHRLLVTSRAYRSDSSVAQHDNTAFERDRENRLFWRMNVRRMEAETVRDAVLFTAGSLDLSFGGPDIDHKQGLRVPRRSLYFRHARERQMEFLQMFDAANPRQCYRRGASIRPHQAFALVNSSLALAQSRLLGRRLREALPPLRDDHSPFVIAAFETVLSRRPSKAELRECRDFLTLQTQQLAAESDLELLSEADNEVPPAADPVQRARENLVLVLINHNDFVTVR